MRCIGRTKKSYFLHRCQNNTKILFCKHHKLQWLTIILAIGSSVIWIDDLTNALRISNPFYQKLENKEIEVIEPEIVIAEATFPIHDLKTNSWEFIFLIKNTGHKTAKNISIEVNYFILNSQSEIKKKLDQSTHMNTNFHLGPGISLEMKSDKILTHYPEVDPIVDYSLTSIVISFKDLEGKDYQKIEYFRLIIPRDLQIKLRVASDSDVQKIKEYLNNHIQQR